VWRGGDAKYAGLALDFSGYVFESPKDLKKRAAKRSLHLAAYYSTARESIPIAFDEHLAEYTARKGDDPMNQRKSAHSNRTCVSPLLPALQRGPVRSSAFGRSGLNTTGRRPRTR